MTNFSSLGARATRKWCEPSGLKANTLDISSLPRARRSQMNMKDLGEQKMNIEKSGYKKGRCMQRPYNIYQLTFIESSGAGYIQPVGIPAIPICISEVIKTFNPSFVSKGVPLNINIREFDTIVIMD